MKKKLIRKKCSETYQIHAVVVAVAASFAADYMMHFDADADVTYCQSHTPLQLRQFLDLIQKPPVVDYMVMIRLIDTLLLVAVIVAVAVDCKVDSFVKTVSADIG